MVVALDGSCYYWTKPLGKRSPPMVTLLTFSETLAIIRDVSIIVFVGAVSLITLAAAFGLFLLYRKVSPVIDSVKKTAKNAEDISTSISQKLVKPSVARSAFAFGAGKLLSFITGVSRRKGGGGKKNG